MSKFGLAVLFDRAGGSITEKMREEMAESELKSKRANELIAEVKERWDEWDAKTEKNVDNMLEYDSFYDGFMCKYFSCYRCSDSKKAIQALDMDDDGKIDWSEFLVYLKWACRQYPNVEDVDELLDITFIKGLIPAMRDEVIAKTSK